MIYKCKICNKEFNQKCHYTNHLNRIKPCEKLTENIHQKNDNPLMEYTIVDEYIIKKNYSCNFCNELFCRSDVLKKHLDRCKIRKEETQDKEIIYQELLKKMESYEKEKENQYNLIKELNNKIEKLENEKKINHTQNNRNIKNQNNGTINTVNIIGFGKENLSKIDNKTFLKL